MTILSTGGSTCSKLNYSISAALNYVQYLHAVVSCIDWLLLRGKEMLCYLPAQHFYLLLLLFCSSTQSISFRN